MAVDELVLALAAEECDITTAAILEDGSGGTDIEAAGDGSDGDENGFGSYGDENSDGGYGDEAGEDDCIELDGGFEDCRNEIAVALHHQYLPKLESTGVLERTEDGVSLLDRSQATRTTVSSEGSAHFPSSHDRCAISRALDPTLCRRVLRVLSETDTDCSLEQLSVRLQVWERAMDVGPVAPETDIRVILHHVHLPRLSDAGIVEYDSAERTVTRGREFSTAVELIEEHWADDP